MSGVTFEEYLQLLKLTERLGALGVAGPYSARKTLKLLDTMAPPFKWLSLDTAKSIDTNRPAYREMVDIFESVRKGNLYRPYESRFSCHESPEISSQTGFTTGSSDGLPDHISVLVDHIEYARINSSELRHYLYSQKKPHLDETFNDKVVNILLLYILTYSMAMLSDSDITHNEVLDSLVSESDAGL